MPMWWDPRPLRKNYLRGVLGALLGAGVVTPSIAGVKTLNTLVSPMTAMTTPAFASGTPDQKQVVINTAMTHQAFVGVGAAVTEASVYCLNNYLTSAQKAALLQEAWGTNGFNTVRFCLGGPDAFRSGSEYTYDDTSGDTSLTNFSIANDISRGIAATLLQILAINPSVRIFASIWSPPAWLKSGGSPAIDGGAFNETTANFTTYANYIVKAIQAYAALGVPIHYLSVQNEPTVSTTYASCTWTAAGLKTFQGSYLGPALQGAGITTKLMAGEDNWGAVSNYQVTQLADATASQYVQAASFHGYSGAASYQQSILQARFPNVEIHTTEYRTLLSNGGTAVSLDAALSDMASNFFIRSLRNGSRSVLIWNFALDQNGAPNVGLGSTIRRGGVIIQNDGSGTVTRSPEYYCLAHIAKYVKPGAVRVDSHSYGFSNSQTDVQTVAFKNPDGSVAVFLWNGAASDTTISLVDRASGQFTDVLIPSRGIATITYSGLTAASPSYPTLAADVVASVSGTNVTSLTVSPTISASANLLMVEIAQAVPSSTVDYVSPTTVTCNNVCMERLDQAIATGSPGTERATEIWYLRDPPTGSVSIVAQTPQGQGAQAPSVKMTAISFIGALPALFGPITKTATTAAGVTSLSVAPSTSQPGITLAAGVARSTAALTIGGTQTSRYNAVTSTNVASAVTTQSNAAPANDSIAWTTADQGALIAVPILSAA